MSITSILQGDSFPELREYIREQAPRKTDFGSSTEFSAFSRKKPLLVPGTTETAYEMALVGAISDYAFCLEILRFVERNKREVFDQFFERIQISVGLIIAGDPVQWRKHQRDFDALKDGCQRYVFGGDVPMEQVIRCADLFHKLDQYHHVRPEDRPRFWETFSEPCRPNVERDVAELVRIFRRSFLEQGPLKKDSTVVLHPWFGIRTSPVGIPDLYADGMLYDFKSSKNGGYSWKDVGQVYGYYLLHALQLRYAPESLEAVMIPTKPLRGIALYYSRFGDIESCCMCPTGQNLCEDELEMLAEMMDEHAWIRHEKDTENLRKSFADAEFFRIVRKRAKGEGPAVFEPETIGYAPGDRVYDHGHGWGIVIKFVKEADIWKVRVAFEDGQTLQGDIRKVILISQKQLEQDKTLVELEAMFRDRLFVPDRKLI